MTVGAPVTSMITKLIAGDGTQADGIGGIGFLRPVIIFSRQMKETSFRKARAKIGRSTSPKFVAQSDGQFERRAFSGG